MDYLPYRIKSYNNWDLYLHKNQFPYIGRCYATTLREDAEQEMNSFEREELFEVVIPEWDKAIKQLFNHDKRNLACLGNEWAHLHWHLIPRYNQPRSFYKIDFIDPNPKGNYSPYPKEEISLEILMDIKQRIMDKL